MGNDEIRLMALEEAAAFCDDAAKLMEFIVSQGDSSCQAEPTMFRKAAAAIRARFQVSGNVYSNISPA